MYTNAVVPGTLKPTIFLMDGNADFQPFFYMQMWFIIQMLPTIKKVDGFRVPGTYGCFLKLCTPKNTQHDHF